MRLYYEQTHVFCTRLTNSETRPRECWDFSRKPPLREPSSIAVIE